MIRRLVLLICSALLMLTGTPYAETTDVAVSVSLAQPFAIHSVDNADLGSMFITAAARTVIVDASSIVPISDASVGNTTPDFTDGTISHGAPPKSITTETTAVIYIQTIAADVNVDITLIGSPTLTKAFSSSPTPILVSGITSNVAAFNSTSSAVGNYMSLAVGPILEIPSNAEVGAYSGTVTVDITAI